MKTIALAAAMLVAAEATEFGYGYYDGYHSHSHDDDDDSSVDKSTWYNKYQQYAPIKIAYKPTTGRKTVYAVCQISDDDKI